MQRMDPSYRADASLPGKLREPAHLQSTFSVKRAAESIAAAHV